MGNVTALEATATGLAPLCFKPVMPLSDIAWQHALRSHLDRQFVDYILTGICKGVHIAVDRVLRLRAARGSRDQGDRREGKGQ